MLTMCPLRCERIPGSTRRVIAASAKKLVSNILRISSSAPSSTAAEYPCPALLTSTSMPPNAFSARATASCRCLASVTSNASANEVSGYARTMSAICAGLRAVATQRWPFSRTRSASALPSPVEQPVMNQMGVAFLSMFIARPQSDSTTMLADFATLFALFPNPPWMTPCAISEDGRSVLERRSERLRCVPGFQLRPLWEAVEIEQAQWYIAHRGADADLRHVELGAETVDHAFEIAERPVDLAELQFRPLAGLFRGGPGALLAHEERCIEQSVGERDHGHCLPAARSAGSQQTVVAEFSVEIFTDHR